VTRVVLLHSGLGDSRQWRCQLPVLAERFEVVAPDLPGYGATPMPPGPFSPLDAVTPLLPGHLVGNSLGGRLALQTALAQPQLVERLVLVGAGLPGWEWSSVRTAHARREEELEAAGDLDAVVELDLAFWLAPEHHDEVRPQLRHALELQSAAPGAEPQWPDLPPLAELEAPTLVVVGDRDLADFRRIAEHIAASAPRAELAVVEGAGHLVGLERPDELNRLLVDFLGAAASPGPPPARHRPGAATPPPPTRRTGGR
jgi:3-oxoadipate enol-lactonase